MGRHHDEARRQLVSNAGDGVDRRAGLDAHLHPLPVRPQRPGDFLQISASLVPISLLHATVQLPGHTRIDGRLEHSQQEEIGVQRTHQVAGRPQGFLSVRRAIQRHQEP